MKRTICTTLLLSLSFGASGFAADDHSAPAQSSTPGNTVVVKARPTPKGTPAITNASSEVYLDVAIPVGQNVVIQSGLDFSSASTVAVSVRCTACTTTTTSMNALGLVLEARWQPLNATTDIATQNASTFAYTDAGGVIFNVYAEQFNLELQNKGTATITLDQVTIFCPAQ